MPPSFRNWSGALSQTESENSITPALPPVDFVRDESSDLLLASVGAQGDAIFATPEGWALIDPDGNESFTARSAGGVTLAVYEKLRQPGDSAPTVTRLSGTGWLAAVIDAFRGALTLESAATRSTGGTASVLVPIAPVPSVPGRTSRDSDRLAVALVLTESVLPIADRYIVSTEGVEHESSYGNFVETSGHLVRTTEHGVSLVVAMVGHTPLIRGDFPLGSLL